MTDVTKTLDNTSLKLNWPYCFTRSDSFVLHLYFLVTNQFTSNRLGSLKRNCGCSEGKTDFNIFWRPSLFDSN